MDEKKKWSNGSGLPPGELKELAIDKHEHMVKRIGDELDRMIKMAAFMREALQNEMFSGLGYKQMGVSEKDLKKMKEAAAIFDTLTSAKIRYDKSMKQLTDSMTPAEERAAVITYIKAQNFEDRKYILQEVHRWQDARREPRVEHEDASTKG